MLTGAANTYTGCLLSLPVNRPAAGYTTGGYDPNAYTPPNVSNARCPWGDCRPSEQEITASLYNSVGWLLEGDKIMQSNGNNRSVRFEWYSAGTYHINVGNIGSGWVLLTGGSAMDPNHIPWSGAPTNYIGTRPWYSQWFHSWNGVTSFGASSAVSNGLTASFSSAPRGTAYFYYRCPSGACPVRKQLHVNVVRDNLNNGFSQSQYNDEINLGNVVVELRKMPGDTFYASGKTYASNGIRNNAGIGGWNSMWFRWWLNGFFNGGLVGMVWFDVDSDTTYKVIVYPPSWYSVPAGAPYHQVQQDIIVTDQTDPYGNYYATSNFGNVGQWARNVTRASLSGTAYTVTIPRDDDVYARTRLIGSQYDTTLTASIVNAAAGYAPWSDVQVRYRLENKWYSTYNPSIEISILTGLVPVWDAILSGTCPTYRTATSGMWSGRNYGYFRNDSSDKTRWSFLNDDLAINNQSNWCTGNPSNSQWFDNERCAMNYAQWMLVTYNSSNLLTNYYSSLDKYPITSFYPPSSDLYTVNNYNSSQSRLRPVWYGLFLSPSFNSNSKTNDPWLSGWSVCDIIINYVVSWWTLGQTYRSRACSVPESSELDSSKPSSKDNCSNIDYQIWLPSCILPAELSGALLYWTTTTRLAWWDSVLPGSGVVAWYDSLVTPWEPTCQSQIRTCTNGSIDGSRTGVNCVQQCVHVWSWTNETIWITPWSSVNGWNTLIATKTWYNCECEQWPISCNGVITWDASGRQYIMGSLAGLLDDYIYPATPICQPSWDCGGPSWDIERDLYEVRYTMSGNTVLNSGTRVIDQVHPNICLKVATFTGRIGTNEVNITFYPWTNTGSVYPWFNAISGSTLSNNTGLADTVWFTSPTNGLFYSGFICGPYVEYNFKNPLYPWAEWYFFYEYKLKESISNNPNANSGSNCVWIYRYLNTNFFTQTPFSALASSIDLWDAASRFLNNYATFSKFNPTTGELYDTNSSSRNRICVPPPTSICAATPLFERFSVPLNLCGNGVQEVWEQCDKGHAPYMVGGRNSDTGVSGSRYAVPWDVPSYDDPLYGNYCKTDCTLGVPLVCNWEAECSNDNIKSIQEWEEYPFWWDLGQVLAPSEASNSGFTRQCVSSTDAGKLMYGWAYTNGILCTFIVTNGLSTWGTYLTGFTVPCFGTGVAASLPMFNLSWDRLIHERDSLPLTATQWNVSSIVSVEEPSIVDRWINTLSKFRNKVTSSQWSYLISLGTGVTQGQLGEYKISLTNIQYSRCNEQKTYSGGSYSYLYTITTWSEFARVCSNRFIVTRPYVIQEWSLLSTITGTSFSDFYTDAKRLVDQTAVGTFSTSVGINNTQVPTYVSMIGADGSEGRREFVNKFIDKYTQLAANNGTIEQYDEWFDGLNGVSSNSYTLRKVPTREIYIYTWSVPLVLSDVSMNRLWVNNPFDGITNLTIISPNANVVVFGNLKERNIMVLTKQNLIFAGWSLSPTAQEVHGIFASNGYGGSLLKNSDRSQRWIDDGRLVVKGMLIGSDIDSLSNKRRSVIEDWFDGTLDELGGPALIRAKRNKLIKGASLRIIPNPQLFISPPPGATELIESLSVAK
jgi:hypothetical protein